MLYVNGSVTNEKSEAGLIIVSPKGRMYGHTLKFMLEASDNRVEYKALLVGMEVCNEYFKAFFDSN